MRSSDWSTSVERSRDLNRRVRAVREREDAEVRPVDVDVLPERGAVLARDREHVVVDRELDVLPRRNEHAPVGPHELDVAARLAELGPEREVASAALPGLDDAERLTRDLGSARLERLVDRRAELLARDEVDERSDAATTVSATAAAADDGDARPEASLPRGARTRRRARCG